MTNYALRNVAFNVDELHNKVLDVLAYAKTSGADAVQTTVAAETGFLVKALNGDVEVLEHHQEKGLDITVYWQGHTASASTSDLSADAIRTTVDKACAIARNTGYDSYAGLAPADLMGYHYPDLQLYHSWDITPQVAIDMAIECEAVAYKLDPRLRPAEGASVSTYNSLMFYGNSHGFIGEIHTSLHTISCSVLAAEKQEMQREHEYTMSRRPSDLDSIAFVAKQAAEKAIARLGSRPIKSRQCPVIFYAPAAKSLLRHFVTAISGGYLYRKSSFLQDSLGKQLFPEKIRIYQQPHLLCAIGSAAFDAEGVKTHNLDYVQDGVLQNYVLGSYSARKLNMQTTGNAGGVYNLEIRNDGLNLTELLQTMNTGLLVTELLGEGVNILTGDYSRGASGFWIERGEIQFPVEQITIAGNLRDIFSNLIAVGNDIDYRGSIRSGSLLVKNMTIAGE